MSEELKDIFECLRKYGNLTPDAIDDLYYIEGYIEDLQQKVEQLENIRKEAIESIEDCKKVNGYGGVCTIDYNHLLNILNKGSNNE